ncbi:MAG: OmpA family protein [Bacteroidales bacterium]
MQADRYFLCFIFLFVSLSLISAQDDPPGERETEKLINQADGYFIYDENYKKAAPIYEELLEYRPGDHNISYKLGTCYLNITGKRKKALELLEYASSNYVMDQDYTSLGSAAHFDALYYLAFAYQENMQLDNAIEYYEKYRDLLEVKNAAEIEYINLQIQSCRNARDNINTDHQLEKELLAQWLISFPGAINPVISSGDSVFVFTLEKEFQNHIFYSRKESGTWSEPADITDELGGKKDMYTNSITADGKTMLIARNDGINGDLYLSHYKKGSWSRLDKLGRTVNTKYWESHGSLNNDGSILFFASNRPGGYGSLDIYRADLDEKFRAGEARNLGPVINTALEENTPYYIDSTATLYFSSTGHRGYGGYDIFYSRNNKNWSQPVHIPYPINTTSDDLNYIPLYSDEGIISMPQADTSSFRNIYLVSIDKKAEPERIIARGEVTLDDGLQAVPDKLKMSVRDNTTGAMLADIRADSAGQFSTALEYGDYSILISYPGYRKDTVNINIPESYNRNEIYISQNLVPERIVNGEFIAVRNILFDFDRATLSRKARIEIEKMVPVLLEHKDLRVCIKGYTDAVGTTEYNTGLSERRADTVRHYLSRAGIEPDRIKVSAEGESEFIADNYIDGKSDNPVGRMYNRRVSISIQNNGYELPVESYLNVPEHVKKPYSYSFYVVIKESVERYPPTYFTQYNRSEFSFINEFNIEDKFIYALGGFRTRIDALSYLVSLREDNVDGAYIITEYDLPEKEAVNNKLPPLYTIQVHALRNKADTDFEGLNNVREIKGTDGFYRYTAGEYTGYSRARNALQRIRKSGYPEAFIKAIDTLEKQSLQDR